MAKTLRTLTDADFTTKGSTLTFSELDQNFIDIWNEIVDNQRLDDLTPADGNFVVGNGSAWVVESGATARSSLGVAIGSDVQAWDADLDTYAANPLTAAELGELQNIDSVTISNTQWGYLGALDQALATTDNVRFNDLELTGTINYVSENNLQVEDKTITVNKGGTAGSAENAGLIVENPNGDESILWDSTSGFDFTDSINVTGGGTFSTTLDVTGVSSLDGGLSITKSDSHIDLFESDNSNKNWRIQVNVGAYRVREVGVGNAFAIQPGGAFEVNRALTATGLASLDGGIDVNASVFTVSTAGAIVGTTLDTGQGANELYAMDQDVQTTDAPTFAGATLNGTLNIYATDSHIELFESDNADKNWRIQANAGQLRIREVGVGFAFGIAGGGAITANRAFDVISTSNDTVNIRSSNTGTLDYSSIGLSVNADDGNTSNRTELRGVKNGTNGGRLEIHALSSSSLVEVARFSDANGIDFFKDVDVQSTLAVTGGDVTTSANVQDDGFAAANGVFGDGSNYQIQSNGDAQFRNIVATGTLSVKEFIAKQISAIGGEEILSSGTGRVESNSVSGSGDNILETVTVTTEDSGSALNAFANGDLVAIRVVDINDPNNLTRVEFRVVQATSTDTVDLVVDTNYHSGDASPLIEGDFMVIYGNIGSGTTVSAYTASTAATATSGTDGRDSLIKRSVLGNPLVTLNSGISSYALGFGGSVNDTIEMAYGDLNGVVTGISSEEYGIVAGDVTLAGNHFLFTENQASIDIDNLVVDVAGGGSSGYQNADFFLDSTAQQMSLSTIFSADGSSDTGTFAGFDFDGSALSTGDGSLGAYTAGTVTGMQKRVNDSTRVLFGGADDNAGTNASFYATADGRLYYDAMGGAIRAQFVEAAGYDQNVLSADELTDNEWFNQRTLSGSGSSADEHEIIRGRYLHNDGIDEITLSGQTKYNWTITDGGDADAVYDLVGEIRIRVLDVEGGSTLASSTYTVADLQESFGDSPFNGSYSAFSTTITGLNATLTAGNYYVIEVAIYSSVASASPGTGAGDQGQIETYLREDYIIEKGTGSA